MLFLIGIYFVNTQAIRKQKNIWALWKKGNGITQKIISMQKTIISLLLKVIKQLPKKLQVVQPRK